MAAWIVCAACSAPAAQEAPRATALRVVSYNIKHGQGMDARLDLERSAGVLAALAPDVVLLQEVDERAARSGGVDQAAWLGERLGLQPRFAPFMDFDGGRYGLATLSRWPIVDSRVIALPPGKQEPRAALLVTLDVDGTVVRVANAHLDWLRDDKERVAQAEALHAALAREPGTVLLGGDLNDLPESATLRVLSGPASGFARIGPEGWTFPSDTPERTIDHFVLRTASDHVATTSVRVIDEAVASDHRPVLAEVTLRRAP